MTFEEYRSEGRERYSAFVEALQQIVRAAVKAQGILPHAITGRAKDPESLAKKLENRGIDPASAIDEQLKDLAGARIVFLTNGQIERFIQSGILHDNFEVLSVNVHHPVPGTESETRLFDSTNYLVELRPDRLELPEYQPFVGMRAEIQVQSLLNHAWAEMDHDTIYKQPQLEHVGGKRLADIKARMDKVMREYLLPAGHDFDKIARDAHQLLEADQRFAGVIDTLANSKDNGELGEAVGVLDDLILRQVDEPQALFLSQLPVLIDVVERTRGTPAGAIEAFLGPIDGRSGEDVALKVSRLIDDWRYADPNQTFAALLRLYAGAGSKAERKIWVDRAAEFSSHNLHVWKAHGPAIPRMILENISKLGAEEISGARGVLVAMLGKILSPEVAGTTSTAMTVTLHHGAVAATEQVATLRADAISVLEKMLDEAGDDDARTAVIKALREAGRPPFNGGDGDLMAMIMADAARIVAIIRERLDTCGLELRRRAEVDALRWHHNYSVLPPHLAEHEKAVAAQGSFAAELQALRARLDGDAELLRYKTLVGSDSVRPDAWTARPFDHRATAKWRESVYPDIIDQITVETAADWINRLRLYIAEPKTGGDHLRPLADFSLLLARIKPAVAVAFIEAMDDILSASLVALLRGLDESGNRDTVRRYAARWMGEGRFLRLIGNYLRLQDDFAPDQLEALMARSIELGEAPGVLASMAAAEHQFERRGDRVLIDKVFMPGVKFVAAVGMPDWIFHEGGLRAGALVTSLDDKESRLLLDSFVDLGEIEHLGDAVLATVAERFPAMVLDFFEARVDRDRGPGGSRFDPIPFSMDGLPVPLSAHPDLLIAAARRWYERDPALHEFRGGRLLHNVFPKLDAIAGPLSDMIKSGDRDDVSFVLATLLAYDGAEHIYPLCMDIVGVLEPGDPLLQRVTQVLAQQGVVVGEFGFVEAAIIRRARLDPFRDDPRPTVSDYVRELQRKIDQSMAYEQRRAEFDVEQRKRDYGED